jgi:hypothetical protein
MVAGKCKYFHTDYINQFLNEPLASGGRLANIEQGQVRKLDADIFSPENRTAAEKVAKYFYSPAGYDMGEPPKFFSGEFSDEAALFLARVWAARKACVVNRMTPYEAGADVHNAFINCWLRARGHGATSDAYDALCCPWECVMSAIRKTEDMFIAFAVRRYARGQLCDRQLCDRQLSNNTSHEASVMLDYVRDSLRHEEPALCAGL